MIQNISHIAIAVNSFNDIKNWKALFDGKFKEKMYRSESQQVDALVFYNNKIKIEFLKPLNLNSPISNFLKKNKLGGIHHISFCTDNFDDNLKVLKKEKIRTITRGGNVSGVDGNKICFLNPMDLNGVLVELEKKEENNDYK
tara:strand:+ start:5251 stop:5676 length:426 start_codon:yes stop_codon:yes gene_type:complete